MYLQRTKSLLSQTPSATTPAAPDGGETLEQIINKYLPLEGGRYNWCKGIPTDQVLRIRQICENALTHFAADQARQQEERIKELENRHVQFMVTGGPVVMATEFDAMKQRAESAEREREEAVLLFIEERRIRGATCHEIAEGTGLTPRNVGRSLARVKDKLAHLRNERSGQRVFTLKEDAALIETALGGQ